MSAYRYVLGFIAAICAAWVAVDLAIGDKAGLLANTPLASARAQERMPALDGAVEWLNTKPLTSAELRGKVVLVDFWTYSCINWQRTLPHVRAWSEKYKEHGLVVIGVHTPEFGFEKDVPGIRTAIEQLNVPYPVAVDSNYTIWRAFNNAYWPALYIVDAKGKIRHTHFGEGSFDRSERVIQHLLVEAGARGVPNGLVSVAGAGSQAEADWGNLRSPETYVGHQRADSFASAGGIAPDRKRIYAAPDRLRLNTWALSGEWTIAPEVATSERANGRILHRFHARDLHLVMGPAVAGQRVPFRVRIDGQPPGAAHGADIDADGKGVLVERRLYQLIRQPGKVDDRLFEIEFLEPGAGAYSFTFG